MSTVQVPTTASPVRRGLTVGEGLRPELKSSCLGQLLDKHPELNGLTQVELEARLTGEGADTLMAGTGHDVADVLHDLGWH